MRRKNADPNKGVVAAFQKFKKKFSMSHQNVFFLHPRVPTSVHGAAFGDKQLQLFNL